MPKLKTFATYKNSGTDFIGNIPDEWAVVKLKYVATILSGYSFKSDDFIDDGIPIIRISDIKKEINWEETKKVSSINEKILRRFIIQENDILIAMTGATIGKTAIYKSSKKALLNQRVGILRNNSNYDVGFLGYVIESYVFREAIRVLSYGGAQENVGTNDLENIYLPLASLTVQNCIVKFLDVKTSEIDTLIADKEKLISLLEEKRQAIITEAVTKGLDPDVKMKDSGVEWIGEIPEHWNPTKINYLVKLKNEKAPDNTTLSYLGLENIESTTGEILNYNASFNTDGSSILFSKDDVLFSKLRPYLAKCVIAPENGRCTSEMLVLSAKNNILHNKFLKFIMLSNKFIEKVNSSTYGAKMPRASWDYIRNIYIPLPSYQEQISIVNSVESKVQYIRNINEKLRLQVSKLKEYRQALIYEAVTGKIDVQEMLKETEQEEVSSL